MKVNSLLFMARILILTMLFAGCVTYGETQGDQTADEHTSEFAQKVVQVPSSVPDSTLVASLKLTAGHVVEFHDFGSSALIVEAAAAYTPPALSFAGPISADQIASIWTHLAPGTPVPPELRDLQRRLTSLPASSVEPEVLSSPEIGGDKIGSSRIAPSAALPAAPVGCNNGCCDSTWLSTLAECQGGGWDYSWFLYNYGWTFASTGSTRTYQGLVCAALGTSTFSVNIGGYGGTWSVPQATYRWYHWVAGTDFFGSPIRQSMTSSVNSSSNSNLHTYCGRIFY